MVATLLGRPFPCLSSSGFWYLVSGGFDVASSSICWLVGFWRERERREKEKSEQKNEKRARAREEQQKKKKKKRLFFLPFLTVRCDLYRCLTPVLPFPWYQGLVGVGARPTTASATRKLLLPSLPPSPPLPPPRRLPWFARALAAAEAMTPRSRPAALVSRATEHCASASSTCIPLTSLAKRASFLGEMRMFLRTALERSWRWAAVRRGGAAAF